MHITTLTNTAAGITEIIKFTGILGLFDLTVDIGATAIEGIYISGTSANGSIISNVFVDCTAANGAQSGLYLDSSIKYVYVWDLHVEGVALNTTAIHLNGAIKCHFTHTHIDTVLIGVHLDHADDDGNLFHEILMDTATTGIQIDNVTSVGNHFHHIDFMGCTTNINNSGTLTMFAEVHLEPKPIATVFPSNLTGVAITAGIGGNTYGAAITEIRSAATATKPYKITGMLIEPDTVEKWGIALYDDGGTTPFWEGVIEQGRGVANVAQREMFPEKYFCAQGTQLSARVKSETGGNNLDIWVFLEVI